MAAEDFIPTYRVPGSRPEAEVRWPLDELCFVRIRPPAVFSDHVFDDVADSGPFNGVEHVVTALPTDEVTGGTVLCMRAGEMSGHE